MYWTSSRGIENFSEPTRTNNALIIDIESGKSIVKVVPKPTSLEILRIPPSFSTFSRTILTPIVRNVNGEHIFFLASGKDNVPPLRFLFSDTFPARLNSVTHGIPE